MAETARRGIATGLVLGVGASLWSLWPSGRTALARGVARVGGLLGHLSPPKRLPAAAEAAPEPDAAAASALAELAFPVLGIPPRVRDSFLDPRARGARVHHAADIPAPRYSPVVAVADGTIVRLVSGPLGGTAIYQADASGRYSFYYAHLEQYRPGLAEGQAVRRGDVIGYVGTSGNAARTAPHLHFAVYLVTDPQRPWGGVPLNPFSLLRQKS